MFPWVLSPVAETELGDIVIDIAERSGSRQVAERVLDEFIEAFDSLAATPGIGFRRPDLTGLNLPGPQPDHREPP